MPRRNTPIPSSSCFAPVLLRRALIIAATIVPFMIGLTYAAELDGVALPETFQNGETTLWLNGYGLRTYSLLGIHIYVAALYLEHPSTDAEQIMQSTQTKLLTIRFERNVSADAARTAWREGLENNCQAPCHLDPADVAKFLSEIPAMSAGDNYSILLSKRDATVSVSGRWIGTVSNTAFATAMLATFLGPRPASLRLKQDLLQGHG